MKKRFIRHAKVEKMDYTGTFEGTIIGAGTKLRTEHSSAGKDAIVT
jgi:hypothetical protein